MPKTLVMLACASLLAFLFPTAFDRYRQRLVEEQRAEAVDPAPPVVEAALPVAEAAPEPAPAGRRAMLVAGADGHYRTEARLNGQPVNVLVDTGATYVSLDETTARRLGVHLAPGDFRYSASTANGEMKVAVAMLDRVRVGTVEIRQVEAVISQGNRLSTTLLGMSFLKKLRRFEVQAGRLNLVE